MGNPHTLLVAVHTYATTMKINVVIPQNLTVFIPLVHWWSYPATQVSTVGHRVHRRLRLLIIFSPAVYIAQYSDIIDCQQGEIFLISTHYFYYQIFRLPRSVS